MPNKLSALKADHADDVYLSANQVCERYGNTTKQSLWRWLNDADMKFPKPITIQRRRFWKLTDLLAWERKRATAA